MQQLHTTIYNIAERPDSGVVTSFTLEEQLGRAIEPEPNDLYADWPINVQVLDKSKPEPVASTAPVRLPRRLKQRVSTMNLKQFIKPVAAAAIILISVLLFFNVPAAKAVDLSQIYEALEKVKNICISRFRAGEQEPWQKTWISRPMGVRLAETKEQKVLWDLQNRIRKAIDTNNDSITKTPIHPDLCRKIEDSLRGSFGFLPFSNISAAPKHAQWNRVDDRNVTATVPPTEVYDLTWNPTKGTVKKYKWRVFIDTETNLPTRAEWYQKRALEEEYTLRSIEVVTYPTDSEMRAVIQSTSD
jgi:outer membrane lipoprotein-sorting protein